MRTTDVTKLILIKVQVILLRTNSAKHSLNAVVGISLNKLKHQKINSLDSLGKPGNKEYFCLY